MTKMCEGTDHAHDDAASLENDVYRYTLPREAGLVFLLQGNFDSGDPERMAQEADAATEVANELVAKHPGSVVLVAPKSWSLRVIDSMDADGVREIVGWKVDSKGSDVQSAKPSCAGCTGKCGKNG